MFRPVNLAILFVLIASLGLMAGQGKDDYFTQNEIDTIRDAQELKLRVPAYFELADRRLIILGVADKSEKQKEKERKAQEQYEKDRKKAGPNASRVKPPVDQLAYLHDFTRAELLRGYIQAIQEVMNNIDDHYSRKLDVRDALEDLEEFTRRTLPLLEKYKPRNANDRAAHEEAIEKAQKANEGAKDALQKVPKTEKKKP